MSEQQSSLPFEVQTMLDRKADIDRRNREGTIEPGAMSRAVSYEFWLRDAVELLLRIELERRQ